MTRNHRLPVVGAVAAAAVVLAGLPAAAASSAATPRPATQREVHGVVRDGTDPSATVVRPAGLPPVAGATVTLAGYTVRTTATGAFTVPEPSRPALLVVRSPGRGQVVVEVGPGQATAVDLVVGEPAPAGPVPAAATRTAVIAPAGPHAMVARATGWSGACATPSSGWTSSTTPPPTIRVYRTATNRVETWSFSTYVAQVLEGEWGGGAPPNDLASWAAGAQAVRDYAWYFVLHGSKGTWANSAVNPCTFDVDDSTDYQYLYTAGNAPSALLSAVAASAPWVLQRGGTIPELQYCRTVACNSSTAVDTCSSQPDGVHMSQTGSWSCGAQGKTWQWILAYYYPGTTLVAGGVAPAGKVTVLTACSLVDTRPGQRETCAGAPAVSRVPLVARHSLTVQVTGVDGVPATATAVLLTVTGVGATAPTALTAGAGGEAEPATSTLQVPGPGAFATTAFVPVGPDGSVTLTAGGATVNVILDLLGFVAPGQGAGYTPGQQCRLLDTRGAPINCSGATPVLGPLLPGHALTVDVAGIGGVPAGATALLVHLTGVGGSAATGVGVAASGGPLLPTAALQVGAGQVASALAVVPLSATGSFVLSAPTASTQVVVDLVGWFANGVGWSYYPTTQCRLFDTRGVSSLCSGAPSVPRTPLGTGATLTARLAGAGGLPASARVAVLALTAVGSPVPGYLQAYPAGGPLPLSSALNVAGPAAVTTTQAVVLGTAGVSVTNEAGPTQVLADLQGYFGP